MCLRVWCVGFIFVLFFSLNCVNLFQDKTVVLVAARYTGQSQNVKTEYACQNLFHGASVGKKFVDLAHYCWVALVRLGKIKCAAQPATSRPVFAAHFILRRDGQTAFQKIALSVGCFLSLIVFCRLIGDFYLLFYNILGAFDVYCV